MNESISESLRRTYRKKAGIAILLSSILAFVIASYMTVHDVQNQLDSEAGKAVNNFSNIMDHYAHTFGLMSELIQREIYYTGGDADQIEKYLKNLDRRLAALEGEDFDGVYMYYQGKYIYSWDTPREVYERRGYNAIERPWYIGAKQYKGQPYFAKPYRSYANDYMLATISQLQPDGETVIAYDIKLRALQSYVNKLNIYKGSLTLICDHNGNIIGSTDRLYTGGNYMNSYDELQRQITEAERELSTLPDDQQAKGEDRVASRKALLAFGQTYRDWLNQLVEDPDSSRCDWANGNLGYVYDNGRYVCIVVIPFQKLMPSILLIWAALSLIFGLALLLIENTLMRLENSREIERKNEQLAVAVSKADAASVAKSKFLAQMSHEIRTPMNAIIGLTSLAKFEVKEPKKVSDYLNKIEGSSKLLLSIINDVLDMSAIEGGKLKIDKAEFNFRQLLTNLTTVFYEQAKQKGITFEVRMNGLTEETIVGDELRLNQVLMNLLSNAIKFTPAGGEIDLMVLQAAHSQKKVQLRFSVSDTGCGMSKEMLGRLFRPFEQESAATARKHGGSGLGLSIAKRLVEMMGGTMQVNSAQGKGSVFTVDIPFGLAESKPHDEAPADFHDVRALIVDDDEESCQYSAILLERLGVRHEYATRGETALEMLGEAEDAGDPFSLCLIDWKMPEMDGAELTEQIREIFGEETLIIIISAYDINELESSGRAVGANFCIPKPLFQSTLFNALMHISGGDYTRIDVTQVNEQFDFSGKRILLAEDVALNMEVAVKLLNMVGAEVICAEDGRQAFDLVRKSSPGFYDCILMDINMPVMDGYESACAIRKLDRPDIKDLPIYAMTANAFSEDVTAALDAGMDGHIAKPIETSVLYTTLTEAFKGRGRQQDKPSESEKTK